jgi:hypothetical protein
MSERPTPKLHPALKRTRYEHKATVDPFDLDQPRDPTPPDDSGAWRLVGVVPRLGDTSVFYWERGVVTYE